MITQKQFSPHSGFTLIELLVVVLVIGILLDLYRQGYLIVSIVKIPVIRPGFLSKGKLLLRHFAAVLAADGLNMGSIRLLFAAGVPVGLAHAVKVRQFHTVNGRIAPFGIAAGFHYRHALTVVLTRNVHALYIVRKNFVHMAFVACTAGR